MAASSSRKRSSATSAATASAEADPVLSFKDEESALVGVSGGADSVALLHWLVEQRIHSRLIVCHLNHGLRGRESGQDSAFVRRLAKRCDGQIRIETEIRKVDVTKRSKQGRQSLETTAREARHELFRDQARKHGTPLVYLAHHAEDQAETVLANLCRGSGLNGLAGMRPETPLNGLILRRPFLQWRRSDILGYLERLGESFREDSSNRDPAHRRNRLRHEVLPLLDDIYGRDVSAQFTRFADQAARDEQTLGMQVTHFLKTKKVITTDDRLTLSPALRRLPPALQSRVIRYWLRDHLQLQDIGHQEIESALRLLRQRSPAKINLPGNHHLRRKAGHLWIEEGS